MADPKKYSLIHGPSLAIGAGIASISIVIAFLSISALNDEPELIIEPVQIPQPTISPTVISSTFIANGSPVLGDPNAPVTFVEC